MAKPKLFLIFVVLIAVLGPSRPTMAQSTHHEQSPLTDRLSAFELTIAGEQGTTLERSRSARWQLAEHRRLTAALAKLMPGRKGAPDAFVLAVALDSDPVFGREAREAARVLGRRYDATARTLSLSGGTAPMGSPANIAAALARIAELMEPNDVLVLYTTSHGAPFGLYYNDGDAGYGAFGPGKLANLLGELGITNRLLLISACYSGVFVGPLVTPSTAIVTAASSTRTSFGCQADNDWTFFGDALINQSLRKPLRFEAAAKAAMSLIDTWERRAAVEASEPQSFVGEEAKRWLATLENALPPATPPVGRPALGGFTPGR